MEIKKRKIGVIEIGIFSSSLTVLGLILWFLTLTFFGSNGNSEVKLLVAVGPSAAQVVAPTRLGKPMPLPSSGEEAPENLEPEAQAKPIPAPSAVAPEAEPKELPASKGPTVALPSAPAPTTVAEMELQPPQPESPRPEIVAVEPGLKQETPSAPPQPTTPTQPTLQPEPVPSEPVSEPESVLPQTQTPQVEASPPTPVPSPSQAVSAETVVEFEPSSGRDPTLSSDEILAMERRKKEAKAQAQKTQEKLILRQKAADPFESLKNKIIVQGVLHTEGGIVAIVNNQIVGKGAEVMGAKILQILGNRVVFKYQNKIFEKNVKH